MAMVTHEILGEPSFLEITNLGDKHKIELWSSHQSLKFYLSQEELIKLAEDFRKQANVSIEAYQITHNKGN